MRDIKLRRNGWAHVAWVESEKTPNVRYQIARSPDGIIGCACMGWVMRQTCKHTDAYTASDLPAKAVRPLVTAERVRVKSRNETFTVTRGIDFSL